MRVPIAAPVVTPDPLPTGAPLLVLVLCLLAGVPAGGRAQAPEGVATMGAAAPARAASARQPGASAARAARSPTSPLWAELKPAQQQALAPLASSWATISEAQKRKWLVISQSYGRLPAPEQEKLHSRMTGWVALSPQQRTDARLNFAETKQLAPDDKKAKWEAYQALPPEEKRKLAAGAASAAKPPATAAAVKPVPARKMATVSGVGDTKAPRLAAGPSAERAPLLPQAAPPAQPASN